MKRISLIVVKGKEKDLFFVSLTADALCMKTNASVASKVAALIHLGPDSSDRQA